MASATVSSVVHPHYLVTASMLKHNPAVLQVQHHLTTQESSVLDQMVQRDIGKPLQVVLLENHAARPDGGHRGAVYVFSAQQRVGAGAPFLGSRLFNQVLILPITDAALVQDEQALLKRFRELKQQVGGPCARPYRLQTGDASCWDASFGTHGGFVKLVKEEQEMGSPNYYLAVHADAGQACQDFYDQCIAPGKLTFAELMQSRELSKLRLYAQRNAKRIMATVARGLGVPFLCNHDTHATVEGSFAAPPPMAECPYQTQFNTLHRRTVYEGGLGDVVIFYSQCCALDRDVRGPGVPYLIGPLQGLMLYRADAKKTCGGCTAPFKNDALNAFPICTGPVQDQDQVARAREVLVRRDGAERFAERVVSWYGKKDGCDALSNPRVYRYQQYNDVRAALHREAMHASHGSVQLKVVHGIIPPP